MNKLFLHINLYKFLQQAYRIKANFRMFHIVGDIYVEFKYTETYLIKSIKACIKKLY